MSTESPYLRVRDVDLFLWNEAGNPPPASQAAIFIHKGPDFLAEMVRELDLIQPASMVELGVYQGGSAMFWEHRYGCRLSAFDIEPEIPMFADYLQRNGLTDRVRLHAGISQADAAALLRTIREDFGNEPSIDAIVDDASHMFDDARASLEALLPFVRPGGVYIIEDWQWGHHRKWPADLWPEKKLLSTLLVEPLLICGAENRIIDRVDVRKNFAVIWRGANALPTDGSFRLRDYYWPRGFSVTL